MQTFQSTVLGFQILGQGLTTLECDVVSCQIQDSEGVVVQQVLSNGINATTPQLVLLHRYLLYAQVMLKHLREVNGRRLTDRVVVRVVYVENF